MASWGPPWGALVAVPVTPGLTRLGHGPFVTATPSLQTAMILAQVFLALMMATNLAVVAALDRRDATADRRRHDDLENLRRAADTDGLTGLANRRRLDRDPTTAGQSRGVRGEPLSLLIPDVDEFKSYNDRFGHPAGDRVLVVVAAAIRSTLRTPTDLPARYGGEEFVVLLPHTGLADASRVEARIRHAVGALAVIHDRAARGTLSMSVGVASARPDDQRADHSRLLTEADPAHHPAERAGRNR